MSEIPQDCVLVTAFERGRQRGVHRAKHYRNECPYGEAKAYQRDAWFAGYDYAFGGGR